MGIVTTKRRTAADSLARETALLDVLRRVDPAQLAERIVDELRRTVGGYARLPEETVRDRLRPIVLYNLAIFFRMVAEDRPPTDDELAPSIESARRDAEEGVSLEDYSRGLLVVARLGWHELRGAVRPEEHELVFAAVESYLEFGHALSTRLVRAYVARHEELGVDDEDRHRLLLEAVLAGRELTDEEAALAQQVGVDRGELRPYALATSAERGCPIATATSFRKVNVLAVLEEDCVRGLLPIAFEESVLLERTGATFAVGAPTAASELAEALVELSHVVRLARTAGRVGRVDVDEAPLERLLLRAPRLGAIVERRVLEPLAPNGRRGSELLETLVAFMENGLERKRTAAALFLHPNSLDYRLGRIRELTGLDFNSPDDVALISLALKQSRLTGDGLSGVIAHEATPATS